MNMLDEALKWLDIGVAPIPIPIGSKIPNINWKRYQTELPSRRIVSYWFQNPERNMALICGGKSHLAVLDFDAIQSYYEWKAIQSKKTGIIRRIVETGYKVKTSRGVHVYVFTNEETDTSKVKAKNLDLRGNGGYVIAPPSIHASGKTYSVFCDGPIYRVPSLEFILPPEFQVRKTLDEKLMGLEEKKPTKRDIRDYHESIYLGIIEDIKNTFSVLSLAQRYTTMERKSRDGRWWVGRCPNSSHIDIHPSFRVDISRGKCRCLSSRCSFSDRNMDVIDLYARLNYLSNKEAIQKLGEELGLLL